MDNRDKVEQLHNWVEKERIARIDAEAIIDGFSVAFWKESPKHTHTCPECANGVIVDTLILWCPMCAFWTVR